LSLVHLFDFDFDAGGGRSDIRGQTRRAGKYVSARSGERPQDHMLSFHGILPVAVGGD
jgi:hypothetical protein